jgi:hypothetical protein
MLAVIGKTSTFAAKISPFRRGMTAMTAMTVVLTPLSSISDLRSKIRDPKSKCHFSVTLSVTPQSPSKQAQSPPR